MCAWSVEAKNSLLITVWASCNWTVGNRRSGGSVCDGSGSPRDSESSWGPWWYHAPRRSAPDQRSERRQTRRRAAASGGSAVQRIRALQRHWWWIPAQGAPRPATTSRNAAADASLKLPLCESRSMCGCRVRGHAPFLSHKWVAVALAKELVSCKIARSK